MHKKYISRFIANINLNYNVLPYLYAPVILLILIGFVSWVLGASHMIVWFIAILSTYVILFTQYHIYGSIKKDLKIQQQKTQAYFTLFSLIDIKAGLPYMTSWAATPELSLTFFEQIKINKPIQIVELGSGITTIIGSYALQQNRKGSIISLDHDKSYAQKTIDQIKKHGLTNYAQIKYTPLVSQQINNSTWEWYDLKSVNLPDHIDLLLIDGPPVKTNQQARFPALPLLFNRLSQNAIIILHDAHRPSERSILEKWQNQFPQLKYEIVNSEKGIAILKKS